MKKTIFIFLLIFSVVCFSAPYLVMEKTSTWLVDSDDGAAAPVGGGHPTAYPIDITADAETSLTDIFAAAGDGDTILIFEPGFTNAGTIIASNSYNIIGIGSAVEIEDSAAAGATLQIASGKSAYLENLIFDRTTGGTLGSVINMAGDTQSLTMKDCKITLSADIDLAKILYSSLAANTININGLVATGTSYCETPFVLLGSGKIERLINKLTCSQVVASVVQNNIQATAGSGGFIIRDSVFSYTSTVTQTGTVVVLQAGNAIVDSCVIETSQANTTGTVVLLSVPAGGTTIARNCIFTASADNATIYHAKLEASNSKLILINCAINTSLIENSAGGTIEYLKTNADANGRVDVSLINGVTPSSSDDIAATILSDPNNLLWTDSTGRVLSRNPGGNIGGVYSQ